MVDATPNVQPVIQSAQANEIAEIYSKPAMFTDKIYTSYDLNNQIARLTFCESWQGGPQMTTIGAFTLTRGAVTSLIKLLQDLDQKFQNAGEASPPTLQ